MTPGSARPSPASLPARSLAASPTLSPYSGDGCEGVKKGMGVQICREGEQSAEDGVGLRVAWEPCEAPY